MKNTVTLRLHVLLTLVMLLPASAHAQRATGLLFMDQSAYQSIPLASTPMLGPLPARVDLAPDFPEPGEQGNQGSCVGWAISYVKAYQERKERSWTSWSNERIFSPAFIYNQLNQSPNCQGGTYIVEALNLVRRDGAATWNTFPYSDGDCVRRPDAVTRQAARQFAIADWRRVNAQDEIEIKNHVASGFPVVIGMVVDQAFANLRSATYTAQGGAVLGGHAMAIVGFDDSRSAFKVINSWGTNWGDNGFGWIAYPMLRAAIREAYVAQDIVTNPVGPIVTPPLPRNPIFIRGSSFVRGMNVGVGQCGPYGTDVLLNGAPCNGRANAAEFDFYATAGGKYQLVAEYASAAPRSVQVKINGATVLTNALAAVTGCWTENCQSSVPQGVVTLKTGPNTLRIERSDVFPHIRSIRFMPVE